MKSAATQTESDSATSATLTETGGGQEQLAATQSKVKAWDQNTGKEQIAGLEDVLQSMKNQPQHLCNFQEAIREVASRYVEKLISENAKLHRDFLQILKSAKKSLQNSNTASNVNLNQLRN